MENTNPKFSNGGKKTWLKLVGGMVAIAAVFVVVSGNTGLFKGSVGDVPSGKEELTPKSCTDNGGEWVRDTASLPAKFAMAQVPGAGDNTPAAPAAPVPTAEQPAAPAKETGHCEYNGVKVAFIEEIVIEKLKPVCAKNGGYMIGDGCNVKISDSSVIVKSADELNSELFKAECKKASGIFGNGKCVVEKIGAIDNIDKLKNIKLRILCANAQDFSSKWNWKENGASWDNAIETCTFVGEKFSAYDKLAEAYNVSVGMREVCSAYITRSYGPAADDFRNFRDNKCWNQPVGGAVYSYVDMVYHMCFRENVSEGLVGAGTQGLGGGIGGNAWVDLRNDSIKPRAGCSFGDLKNDPLFPDSPVKVGAGNVAYTVYDSSSKLNIDAGITQTAANRDFIPLYQAVKKQLENIKVFMDACIALGGIDKDQRYHSVCILGTGANRQEFDWQKYPAMLAKSKLLNEAAAKEAQLNDANTRAAAAEQQAAQRAAEQQAADEQARQAELAKLQAENDKQIKELEAKLMGATQALSAAKAGAEREKEKAVSAAETKALTETVKNLQQMLAGEKAEKDKLLLQQQAAAAVAAQSAPSSASSDADAKIQDLQDQVRLMESMSKNQPSAAAPIIVAPSATTPSTSQSDDEFKKLMLQMMMQLMQNQNQNQTQSSVQGEIEKMKLEIEKLKLEKEQALKGAATKKPTTKKKPAVKSKTTTK